MILKTEQMSHNSRCSQIIMQLIQMKDVHELKPLIWSCIFDAYAVLSRSGFNEMLREWYYFQYSTLSYEVGFFEWITSSKIY